VQVSRLAEPLINEVIIPMGKKDFWNSQYSVNDSPICPVLRTPRVGRLASSLYPGVFPTWLPTPNRARTWRPFCSPHTIWIIPGFQNFTSKTPSDLLS